MSAQPVVMSSKVQPGVNCPVPACDLVIDPAAARTGFATERVAPAYRPMRLHGPTA